MSFFKPIGYTLLGAILIAGIPLWLVLTAVGTLIAACYCGGKALCEAIRDKR